MPDPARKTVSASQIAALFDASPYQTRFTLWHEINGTLPDVAEDKDNNRMEWGRRLQGAIVLAASERRNVVPWQNSDDVYARHPHHPIGCTIDAEATDPSIGPGVFEAKNVDWLIWKNQWTETEAPPHVELQVQAQLAVMDRKWADICCLVGGNELRIYPREPEPELVAAIIDRATAFMQSIRDRDEPEPIGAAIEDPFVAARWPRADNPEPLDLTQDRDAHELVREYAWWKGQESVARKTADDRKRRLLALAKDAATLRTWGHRVHLTKTAVDAKQLGLPVDVFGPLNSAAAKHPDDHELQAAVDDVGDWTVTLRRQSIRTTIKVDEIPTEGDPPWGEDFDGELTL